MDKQKAREILLEMAFAERTEFAEDRLFAFGYSEEHEALQIGIECIEKLAQIEGAISDLRETINEAYKLNDYVLDKVIRDKQITECESIAESYSLKAMQNLGWLMGVLDND